LHHFIFPALIQAFNQLDATKDGIADTADLEALVEDEWIAIVANFQVTPIDLQPPRTIHSVL